MATSKNSTAKETTSKTAAHADDKKHKETAAKTGKSSTGPASKSHK